MKCVFCHVNLDSTNYCKSKQIPKEKNHFFIVCKNCNVVMKARIKNNKIEKIEEAPMHDLVLAADLFKLNNNKVEGFKLNYKNNLSKYVYDHKTLKKINHSKIKIRIINNIKKIFFTWYNRISIKKKQY